jgi:hypothetical protein
MNKPVIRIENALAWITAAPGSAAIWDSMGNYTARVMVSGTSGHIDGVTIGRPQTDSKWGNQTTLTFRPLPVGHWIIGKAVYVGDNPTPSRFYWDFHEAPMYGEC